MINAGQVDFDLLFCWLAASLRPRNYQRLWSCVKLSEALWRSPSSFAYPIVEATPNGIKGNNRIAGVNALRSLTQWWDFAQWVSISNEQGARCQSLQCSNMASFQSQITFKSPPQWIQHTWLYRALHAVHGVASSVAYVLTVSTCQPFVCPST